MVKYWYTIFLSLLLLVLMLLCVLFFFLSSSRSRVYIEICAKHLFGIDSNAPHSYHLLHLCFSITIQMYIFRSLLHFRLCVSLWAFWSLLMLLFCPQWLWEVYGRNKNHKLDKSKKATAKPHIKTYNKMWDKNNDSKTKAEKNRLTPTTTTTTSKCRMIFEKHLWCKIKEKSIVSTVFWLHIRCF